MVPGGHIFKKFNTYGLLSQTIRQHGSLGAHDVPCWRSPPASPSVVICGVSATFRLDRHIVKQFIPRCAGNVGKVQINEYTALRRS